MQCTAKTKAGNRCKRPAIKGGKVCWHHGGAAPQVREAGKRRVENQKNEARALKAVEAFGLAREIGPQQALLEGVSHSAGVVSYLRRKTSELSEQELAGMLTVSERYDEETGFFTITKAATVNVWVRLLGEWEDRLAKMSKIAIDAGIAERQVRIMEEQANKFAGVLYGVLADLGVDMGDETVAIVRRHMMSLDTIDVEEAD